LPKRAVSALILTVKTAALRQREDDCDVPQAKYQWQYRDLADHHQIIGMPDEAVRAAIHQRFAGHDDNPGGPAIAQRSQHPDATGLYQGEQSEEGEIDRPARRQPPQRRSQEAWSATING
jgi:hypothetical protein